MSFSSHTMEWNGFESVFLCLFEAYRYGSVGFLLAKPQGEGIESAGEGGLLMTLRWLRFSFFFTKFWSDERAC